MHEVAIAVGGLVVGFTVGLTGMGGGALMTPMLVLLFGVQPLAAVSSDLVAAVVMKPIGGAVHARRGTINKPLVGWLSVGSIPAAFTGVLILKTMGQGATLQDHIKVLLGTLLLVAAIAMVARWTLGSRRAVDITGIRIRPGRTVLIGVVGGLVVGMTSVGSGSLIIVLLMLLYPALTTSELVGTDLVQAIPLVLSAAVGHLLFGDFKLGLTGALLIGSVPGVYIGARLSARANDRLIRPALFIVLVASALKLLDVGTNVVAVIVVGLVIGAAVLEIQSRRDASMTRSANSGRQISKSGR